MELVYGAPVPRGFARQSEPRRILSKN